MTFVVKFLYSVLLFPPGIFILALLVAAGWNYRRNRGLFRLAVCFAALLYIVSIPAISNKVIHSLESRYTPPREVQGDVIVMLGGGATLDTPNIGGQGHLYGHAANRLLTAVALYRQTEAPIIVSGGKVYATTGVEAEIAKAILVSLGVPAEKIIMEAESLNTTQNARFTARILEERGFTRPILVTSAFHMERAVLQFDKAGVAALPFPTDYQTNVEETPHFTDFWPAPSAMSQLVLALKEYVGIAAVRWY